ncbi:conjugative transposon TraN protein [Filimonas zeae]|uniref:Conjugative transposon protein TraN n=1 Tax=Filimonas zeae TaxID=1737353 RepID=A0A917IRR6_9BACT|nr:conjugative transposon protein TraN [Filimonas zeae]MDR6337677.1 conjugative transposon TraN protein [Filimonas zeae]GGH59744.1 conjugative transposon protein TraN [Filimonas zeae]
MKKIMLLAALCLTLFTTTYAQLPLKHLLRETVIEHYKIEVSYYYTTVLIFPFAVIDADRGFKELLAEKQQQVGNVLKLKANRKDFVPTNLHVYTADGKVFAFDVTYNDTPTQTTFDLNRMPTTATYAPGPIQLSHVPYNETQLQQIDSQVRGGKNFLHLKNKNEKMKLSLKSIYSKGDMVFLKLELTNQSGLDYTPDFIRAYVQDKQKIKRSSVQQREVKTIYQSPAGNIEGKQKATWILAVPRFTLADNKQFYIEVFEKNGGRFVSLTLKNKHLLKSRKLQ